jgi:hypothetical protein
VLKSTKTIEIGAPHPKAAQAAAPPRAPLAAKGDEFLISFAG